MLYGIRLDAGLVDILDEDGEEDGPQAGPEQTEEQQYCLVAEPFVPVVEDQDELNVDEEKEQRVEDDERGGECLHCCLGDSGVDRLYIRRSGITYDVHRGDPR